MSARDLYQVLGVARDASPATIRAAFVRLAKQHHPDNGSSADLSRRLHDVQQAYRCLSDPDARARHDQARAEVERTHVARQRSVQRRLHRYDARHPRPRPRPYRRFGWRSLLAVAVGAAIVARVSLGILN